MKRYPEKLISAFLSNFKVKDIAASAGVSVSTVNKYSRDPDFMALLNERRAAIVSAAVDRMTETILDDAGILQRIIGDDTVNPAVRVTAISEKWRHLREWTALADFEKRLLSLERARNGDSRRFRPGDEVE